MPNVICGKCKTGFYCSDAGYFAGTHCDRCLEPVQIGRTATIPNREINWTIPIAAGLSTLILCGLLAGVMGVANAIGKGGGIAEGKQEQGKKSETKQDSSGPVVTFDSMKLIAEFKGNGAKFEQYAGKRLIVKGALGKVEKDVEGKWCLYFQDEHTPALDVKFVFANGNAISSLTPKQIVTVSGTCQPVSNRLIFSNCTIE